MEKKFNSSSDRYKGFDYSSPGIYFITIDTFRRNPFFGAIESGRLSLNESGQIARKFWLEIPDHFPNVTLDSFIIMPDHLHGIIVIKNKVDKPVRLLHATAHENNDQEPVETLRATSLQDHVYGEITPLRATAGWYLRNMSAISPQSGSLGAIIRSYKSAVTKEIRGIIPEFKWQQGYYDHIVRTYDELLRIQSYIIANPQNWKHRNKEDYPWE